MGLRLSVVGRWEVCDGREEKVEEGSHQIEDGWTAPFPLPWLYREILFIYKCINV